MSWYMRCVCLCDLDVNLSSLNRNLLNINYLNIQFYHNFVIYKKQPAKIKEIDYNFLLLRTLSLHHTLQLFNFEHTKFDYKRADNVYWSLGTLAVFKERITLSKYKVLNSSALQLRLERSMETAAVRQTRLLTLQNQKCR